MNKTELQNLIAATKGRFFSVEFRKKDGTRRILNGKEKYLRLIKGGEGNLANTQYIHVVDRNLDDWRAVNSDTVACFKCGKIEKIII